jgi:uncharacterized membrane protein
MRGRARLAGHAVHPMLIVLPLGLFVAAVVFDALVFLTGSGTSWCPVRARPPPVWSGALVAELFGWVDWLTGPGHTRTNRVRLMHGLGNMVVLALFAVSWLLRLDRGTWEPDMLTSRSPDWCSRA